MSWAQQRLKLKQTPIDSWSLKEQLTLALAVLRTGDQNWVSVSRTMKQFNEPGRPLDWYSQKNCALQYNLIMENRDIPKRKRGDKIDAKDDPGETIVRMLSQKRMEQLKDTIDKEKDEIRKLEKQVELLSSDNVSEQELDKILKEIQREEDEEERKRDAHAQFIKDREDKKLAIQAALKSGYFARGASSSSSGEPAVVSSSEPQPAKPDSQTQLKADSTVPPPASQKQDREEEPVSASDSFTSEAKSSDSESKVTKDVKVEEEESEAGSTDKSSDQPSEHHQLPVTSEAGSQDSSQDKTEEPPSKNEPDVVDLEPPTETEAADKPETEKMKVDEDTESRIDQDDDEMHDDAEEIAGSIADDERETETIKTEVKEEIVEETVKEETDKDEKVKEAVKEEVKEEEKVVEEIKKEQDTEEEKQVEESVGEAETEPASASMEVDEQPVIREVEVKIEKGLVRWNGEVCLPGEKEAVVEEKPVETPAPAPAPAPSPAPTPTPTPNPAPTSAQKSDKSEPPPPEPSPVPAPEPEVETKRTPTTKAPQRSRGRPRSKKNSEVVPEPSSEAEAQSQDQQPSSGQQTGAHSSPASTRPTSPSSDSPAVTEPPSTPKLLEQTSSRLIGRRSSRQGLARALKEAGGGGAAGGGGGMSSSAPVSPLPTEDEKEYKSWKKGMLLVWNQIAAHKHANIFAGPVSETDAPDYKAVVFEPMDLGTIKKNIESGIIRTTEEFQRDLSLMFFNATMYNSSDHPVHTLTLAMQKDTEKMIKEFLNTQALMKANEAPKLRMKETVKVMTSRTRTGSGSQGILDDKKKSM